MNPPAAQKFENPFRPGAGHMPPYLAGRKHEENEFRKLLKQETILQNLILTGLRGIGKTVLLETFKPLAIQEGWLWVGSDLSESASVSEESLATRMLTDLAVVTSTIPVELDEAEKIGFVKDSRKRTQPMSYAMLHGLYNQTPGLVSDKIKGVLEFVWKELSKMGRKGIIFAYDEAQNLSDLAPKEQYPLSMLLDVFQSIQRKNIPFMLALTGLPTLFPKLVEARTFSERMFHVVVLNQLDEANSRDAILIPIKKAGCPVSFNDDSVTTIYQISGGYPFFIQFICKEVYDIWTQNPKVTVPVDALIRKLDSDFFAGRWAKATDRERDLLFIAASLPNCDAEFTVQDIVASSKAQHHKPFSSSHVNQMFNSLIEAGLVYRNRYGKYSFAVPLLGQFISRQAEQAG
ncbi:MAG TPA: hypothetical protein VHE58_03430 [Burkholderiales bacterium]|nr:hypothetical protein [Burkholderiales bacterium]